jgi:hypothetical protein
MSEKERNQQVADRICESREWSGRQYHLGEYLALLDGAVVAEAGNLDGALRALRNLDPDPARGMIVEVSPPITDVIR